MKALVVAAFSVFMVLNSLAASNNTGLEKEIHKKAFINLEKIELDKSNPNYVDVKFVIRNSSIYIVELKGTHDQLELRVQERLKRINVKANYDVDKEYAMRFNFEVE